MFTMSNAPFTIGEKIVLIQVRLHKVDSHLHLWFPFIQLIVLGPSKAELI